jgi:phytoene synthase
MDIFPPGSSRLNEDPVQASYAWCRALAKDRAKNFYYSFALLSRRQHDAMCAVYAFMRVCDDLSDEPGISSDERRRRLQDWRSSLELALGGLRSMPAHPVWLALYDTVLRYRIPAAYLHEMIDGVGSDVDFRPVETFDQLYRYCYQVASVVGLTIIHIFGFESARALALAEKCGIAFQLTNILRDVKEDAANGRVYLPAEDLARFGVSAELLAAGPPQGKLRELLEFQATRARGYYLESAGLVELVNARSRASLRALIRIYSELLDRIVTSGYDVFTRRIALSKREKLWILATEALRP